MKNTFFFTAVVSLFIALPSYASTKIESKDAPFYEGQNVVACGLIKEVSRFKRGFYLNLDDRFPKQSLTLVIWEDDVADIKIKHGSLQKLVGKEVCGKGTITEHKGHSQISLYNSYSLQVG